MSEQTTTWPDLVIGLFEKLTGRGAQITSTSLRARMAGLRTPGLRLRSGRLVCALLAAD